MSKKNSLIEKKRRREARALRKAEFAASHPRRKFVYRNHSKDYSQKEPESV